MEYMKDNGELEDDVNALLNAPTINELKRAIPTYCFKPSFSTSLFYLFRDLLSVAAFGIVAWLYIPHFQSTATRYIAWMVYGYVQGLAFTGLWVLAHECGHGAFSPSQPFNDFIGLITDSALLAPYHAWKSTHRRHHKHANNLAKDHNYVPAIIKIDAANRIINMNQLERVEDLSQDAPIAVLSRLLVHQLLGLLMYFTTNMTASEGSLKRPRSKRFLGNSHFLPISTLFPREEAHLILISDIGILIMLFVLYQASNWYGFGTVALLYGQPYMWCNHWIVAITYLHHTDTKLPKYQDKDWTFLKGALSTIDRKQGWIGKHMWHNIADYHVIHHLFSQIPHYHTQEATKAIIPLLGSAYQSTDQGFLSSLWQSFSRCRWVEPDEGDNHKGSACWYKSAQQS